MPEPGKNLRTLLNGLTEVRGALAADARGVLEEVTSSELSERDGAVTARALGELATAGTTLGLSRLELLLVRGPGSATVTAVRPDAFVLARVDPARGTAQVEEALRAWAGDGGAKAASSSGRGRAVPPPLPQGPAAEAAPAAAVPTPMPAPSVAGARSDPWAAWRRSLVRGLLTEAAAQRRELLDTSAGAGRAGAEPIAPAALDRAMLALVQGAGSVLAGDGLAGVRALEPLAAEAHGNLSVRWLALHWSGRAALKSGNSPEARTRLTQALALAKQLDGEALSASQWTAGELLAQDGDPARALSYLAAARAGFERLGDGWGLGQARLAEARVLIALDREQDALAAARAAAAANPSWEEPPVFLARRALARGELGEAEGFLRSARGASAERARSLVDAIRRKLVSQEDAAEFLRESDAPPTARSIRAMERIARTAPRFLQAREALAWMLLKVGKYGDASTLFRGLLAQPLGQADRASVMLGLGCIAHAQQPGKDADVRLHAAVTAARPVQASSGPGDDALPAPSASSLPGRSSQLTSGGPVFSGRLSEFPLPDVVEFVRSARRTGLLVCSSERGMAAVHFRAGRITGAESAGTPDVGELLLRARKISSVALRALRTADQPDHVLAELLVREGLVEAAAVEEALRWRVELTILELVRWKDGEFAFSREGEDEPAGAPVPVEFDAQDVLLNVLRQLDEDARASSAPALRP
jgi:tetratricopeptide (TPR) repeat protein